MHHTPIFAARALALIASILIFTACQHNDKKPQNKKKTGPLEQTILIRQSNPENPLGPKKGPVIEKKIFNIVVNNQMITVNGVKISNIKALRKLLRNADKPVITLTTHKCLDGQKAAELLSLAQQASNTPITFSSYGTYKDASCE